MGGGGGSGRAQVGNEICDGHVGFMSDGGDDRHRTGGDSARHGLFDVELTLNRTVVFGLLTAAVVGVILNLTIWFVLHVLFAHVTEARAGPLRWYEFDPLTLDLKVAALAVVAAAAITITPWVVRNRVQVGCLASTTDARASGCRTRTPASARAAPPGCGC